MLYKEINIHMTLSSSALAYTKHFTRTWIFYHLLQTRVSKLSYTLQIIEVQI